MIPGLASTLPRIQLSRSVTVWSRNSSLSNFVSPLAESAFSELLNVAFVHEGDGLAACFERVADGIAYQPLGAEDGDGLDAYTGILTDLFLAAFQQIVVDETDQLRRVRHCLA